MELKIKKLHDKAVMPKKAHPTDAGIDLTAVDKITTDQYIEYKTGLAMEIPAGHVGLLIPRSSMTKKDLMMKNSIGVIDSDYRGEVTARFIGLESGNIYEVGERIAQLVIIPIPELEIKEVKELNKTIRGEGGYGSTGK